MEDLTQPDPVAAAETPEAEMARLRQELQHFRDAALQQQAMYMGQFATAWAPTHLFGGFGIQNAQQGLLGGLGNLLQPQWAPNTMPPLTQMDAEVYAGHQADLERQRVAAQEALTRALDLLEEKIGPAALAKIQAGGGFEITSRRWPNVVYLVPRDPHEMVKVLADGNLVTEVCIVSTDASLPWPDILLHRITAIEADESILFATGVVHPRNLRGRWARLRGVFLRDRATPGPGGQA